MSSVIDYSRCPQCGGTYVREFYYKTNEKFCCCYRCGKSESRKLMRDEERNLILDENCSPQYVEESHAGYGAAFIEGSTGVGAMLRFLEPVNEQTKAAFMEALAQNPGTDKSKCYLSAWDDEKQEVIALYGTLPPLYTENDVISEGQSDFEAPALSQTN